MSGYIDVQVTKEIFEDTFKEGALIPKLKVTKGLPFDATLDHIVIDGDIVSLVFKSDSIQESKIMAIEVTKDG